MSKKRTGVPTLAYMGVEASTPPQFTIHDRAPLTSDYYEYELGHMWLYETTPQQVWILTSKTLKVATWLQITQGGTDTFTDLTITNSLDLTFLGAGTLRTDAAGVVSVYADGTDLEVYMGRTGLTSEWGTLSSSGGTVTITKTVAGINFEAAGGTAANTFTMDDGLAIVPTAGGNVFVTGGSNLHSDGAVANTINIDLDDNVTLAGNFQAVDGTFTGDVDVTGDVDANDATFTGNVSGVDATFTGDITFQGAYGVVPPGGGVQGVTIDANGQLGSSAGGAGPINSVVAGTNINLTGTAADPVINVDDDVTLAGFLDATTTVTAGTGITSTTGNIVATAGTVQLGSQGRGVVQSDATGLLSSSEGTDGQLLISSSAGAPAWANITQGSGITITNAANSITLTGTGLTINDQVGTAYTLVLADAGKMVRMTNVAAITLTVPTNATAAFPVGTEIILTQGGAGTVTVAGAVGVTVNSASAMLDLYEQYSAAALIKTAADIWLLAGDIK